MVIKLNKNGEVADFADVSQFETGESAYQCGFFTVYLNKAMGPPDAGPTQTPEWIDQQADASYKLYNGTNDAANRNGMSIWQLWTLLGATGQRYVWFAGDKDLIKAWVQVVGTPVIITVDETSVNDVALGGKVPYSWTPSGTHIITVSGIAADGNFLVRDTASIAASGVRPGPRTYDASKLVISQATAVLPTWVPNIAQGYNPLTDKSVHPTEHTYTILSGDTLGSIAVEQKTSIAHLLASNQTLLDQTAQQHGYTNSNNGNVIFPDTVLVWV